MFAGTIKENLLFVKPDVSDDEITDALNMAACEQLIRDSAKGINTYWEKEA